MTTRELTLADHTRIELLFPVPAENSVLAGTIAITFLLHLAPIVYRTPGDSTGA